MAISRADAKTYFLNFDIEIDTLGKKLNCFKCGYELNYVSSTIGYRCKNSHAYTISNMVFNHADFVASSLDSLNSKDTCK